MPNPEGIELSHMEYEALMDILRLDPQNHDDLGTYKALSKESQARVSILTCVYNVRWDLTGFGAAAVDRYEARQKAAETDQPVAQPKPTSKLWGTW